MRKYETMMTLEMWNESEPVLAKLNAGYKIDFDNHNGTAEMLIHIDSIGVMRRELQDEA